MKKGCLLNVVRILLSVLFIGFVIKTVLDAFRSAPDYVSECLHLAGLPRWFTVIPVVSVFLFALRAVYGFLTTERFCINYFTLAMLLLIFQFAPAITGREPSDERCVMGLMVPCLGIVYTILLSVASRADAAAANRA